jgi:HPt (histidine-containing phosphotransfer) domain-containing protein
MAPFVQPPSVCAMTLPARDDVLDADLLAELRALDQPGDPSLVTEMIEAFAGSAPGFLVDLRAALATGNSRAFGDAAHALKGSSGSVGAMRLSTAAGELERRGRAHDLTDLEPQLSAAAADYAEALAALLAEDLRSRQHPAPWWSPLTPVRRARSPTLRPPK